MSGLFMKIVRKETFFALKILGSRPDKKKIREFDKFRNFPTPTYFENIRHKKTLVPAHREGSGWEE